MIRKDSEYNCFTYTVEAIRALFHMDELAIMMKGNIEFYDDEKKLIENAYGIYAGIITENHHSIMKEGEDTLLKSLERAPKIKPFYLCHKTEPEQLDYSKPKELRRGFNYISVQWVPGEKSIRRIGSFPKDYEYSALESLIAAAQNIFQMRDVVVITKGNVLVIDSRKRTIQDAYGVYVTAVGGNTPENLLYEGKEVLLKSLEKSPKQKRFYLAMNTNPEHRLFNYESLQS